MHECVHWPNTPVERLQDFQPGLCPWPECREHLRTTRGYRFQRQGIYGTNRRPKIPRFRCLSCRRSFSRQSFSTSCYLKRPELLVPVAAGLVAGSAHRQIARSLFCSGSTVTRLSARLGRHALLLQSLALQNPAGAVTESLAADHFETFEFTQHLPFGVLTLVGRDSWFVYGIDPAPHARTGMRTTMYSVGSLFQGPGHPPCPESNARPAERRINSRESLLHSTIVRVYCGAALVQSLTQNP